ncbi:DUF3299 domain-containing protein [Vibrio agarivorans]|uniref:DUF3299 domain-containing protein n=1 Tax=Vibrio agarivorans TaxID=153622 RepID=A0ABT7Y378_9VIBR|nr:DUF3299 domain-containing protein [Vibrio agarivorans]MDN2482483.1 DUF3299 domain-containing protein [Vibrio agarivorans]
MRKLMIILLSLVSTHTWAAEPLQLEWNDLNKGAVEVTTKLPDLTDPQKRLLQEVIVLQQQEGEAARTQLDEALAQLKEQGIDAEQALQARQNYMQEMQASARAVNTEFDGKTVRVPGFVVPISFNEEMLATELLLVPVAGACIHMPPPPANQIVRISYPQGFKVQNVQYPVWVEGDFHSNVVTEEVYLVDGKSNLSMGYEMTANTIEDYYQAN